MAYRDEKETGKPSSGGGQAAETPPTISLPKGGGAIRGIGEKFAANPVTGTASLTVPIATSPGRSGFGPQLELSYDSGAGNGPFGFGWQLAIPSITRKTDKGLPRYRDADESDVFILSGAEDLVPVLFDGNESLEHHAEDRSIGDVDYEVRRYRPRIEGLFARIERWTSKAAGAIHWRAITRDNVTNVYGGRDDARIADSENPNRVFSWMLSESFDDRGNVICYRYKREDAAGVDPALPHERSRLEGPGFAQRYLKRIHYGNRKPRQPGEDLAKRSDWLFEVVFDYDDGHYDALPLDPRDRQLVNANIEGTPDWSVRLDPFSSFRAGFEHRSYRLCRRVLMFHRFPAELGTEACLVRSTAFDYEQSPVASFITAIRQSGYVLQDNGSFLERSLPLLELEYSRAEIDETVRTLDPDSAENLPAGIAGAHSRWVDLDGEGLTGLLSENADSWSYKRNLGSGRFAALERVAARPALAALAAGRTRFMDLAGDGRPDLVQLEGPTPGFCERGDDGGWSRFTAFSSGLELDWDDPNLRFIDLTGDGLSDVLVSEDAVFSWYPSLGERGFGPAERAATSHDEERGPRLVFADEAESIHLADLSGDGLTDILRIRNGEVCYWPNLGYGRFGARVLMTAAPRFDTPDQFDPAQIRLADIDGTGLTDILYLGRDHIDLYFNQSGNGWSEARSLRHLPTPDPPGSVSVVDLLGTGTACLVWSSPLPADRSASLRYVDLMASGKPHLLRAVSNNLGAETRVRYAPSTKFYVADRVAGKPWVTKLPFPVQVVEQVETYDRITNNRFVSRYAYHHGYFDGPEREFRGFGMVEQWDTEEYTALEVSGELDDSTNLDESSHLPPVRTRTWFHTGAHLRGGRISRHFEDEYYREPGISDEDIETWLLPDTPRLAGLSIEEERQAVRALKGSILRQEVYGRDGSDRAEHPYTVSERSYAIRMLQPLGDNRAAVFLVHPGETIEYHYERNQGDPRIRHQLTAEVDDWGNVRKAVAIGYGRRPERVTLSEQRDRDTQTTTLITATENDYTDPVDETAADLALVDDAYRTPLPAGSRTWQLTGYGPSGDGGRFVRGDFVVPAGDLWDFDDEIDYELDSTGGRQRRLIEQVATRYRSNDLAAALPHRQAGRRALADRSYRLAFTPGLLQQHFGDRVTPAMLGGDGGYVDLEGDGRYWIPTGRSFHSPGPQDAPAVELTHAEQHFFLPFRFTDPFGETTAVAYDDHDLLLRESIDPLRNRVAADNDYRVLQPYRITDANGNLSEAIFDALGLIAGTAVMDKEGGGVGDSIEGVEADLDKAQLDAFFTDPRAAAADLLGDATTRIVYDLDRFGRAAGDPGYAATLARDTHVGSPPPPGGPRIRVGFSYSDGFGRGIQEKAMTAPGPLDLDKPDAPSVDPRWVGSGWTIFDNKGNEVRRFEPFFSPSHDFEPELRGFSSILLRDPLGRLVATLHPNGSYDKVVFDPWRRESWDVNDTIHPGHRFDPQDGGLPDSQYRPTDDPDVGALMARLPESEFWPTWYRRRMDPVERLAAWPDQDEGGFPLPHNQQVRADEQLAAEAAARHAATPSVAHFDGLGRGFLTVSDNGRDADGIDQVYESRVELDIEGNQRTVLDARGRTVLTADYDMLSNQLWQRSMDAGQRLGLSDVMGRSLYAWDDRRHRLRWEYDALGRLTHLFVSTAGGPETLAERTVYGESETDPELRNLRRRVCQVFDSAGVVTHLEYDFKGNLLASRRQLRQDCEAPADWSQDLPLEPESWESATVWDAFNRAMLIVAPHSDRPGSTLDVIQPGYDEAGLLHRIDAWLARPAAPTGPLDPATADFEAVRDIDYDAKGQRTRISYGNGVVTDYDYDPETFRLVHLQTLRSDSPAGRRRVQDLRYAYDPVGNIHSIRDGAQQPIYFDNAVVEAHAEYGYDPIYRLIRAVGREHPGQNPGAPGDWDDTGRGALVHRHDGSAMRRYAEDYRYDDVGNILAIVHQANGGSWTRDYSYEEASPIEAGETGNRLSETTAGAVTEGYAHDAHGNMTRMPHLPVMSWNFEDQLVRSERQVVGEGGTPERSFYVYDAAGTRVRKITQRQNGTRKRERIYLGGFDVAREYDGDGTTLSLERQSLHVMDDGRRVAIIETRSRGDDGSPQRLVRFQLDNHLESAAVELDDQGETISYEEYYPYGGTSFQSVDKTIKAAAKRYRFSGKERDEETNFYANGARYYAPWLGRWTAADPAGLADGHNLFAYAHGNPVMKRDPSGTTNVPATTDDRRIMMMNDAQLHRHMKSLSPEARASFARGATGMFATRAWATLNRGGMDIGYRMPAAKITAAPPKPKPKPPATTKPKYTGGATLPNVEHTAPWLPKAVVRETWEGMIDEAANSANPWYTRGAYGVGAVVGYFGTFGELVVHGAIAAPQVAVTETVAAGEHLARTGLLVERGSYSAAVDEGLAAAQSWYEGVAGAAATVAMIGGGVQAIRARMGTRVVVDPLADPVAPTVPAPPPSQPPRLPPELPPKPPGRGPVGPTETPGPWAPDTPPGKVVPGFDPRNPRIPKPPRLPNIPKIDYSK